MPTKFVRNKKYKAAAMTKAYNIRLIKNRINLFLITLFEKSHWSLADGMNRIANLDLLYSFV